MVGVPALVAVGRRRLHQLRQVVTRHTWDSDGDLSQTAGICITLSTWHTV